MCDVFLALSAAVVILILAVFALSLWIDLAKHRAEVREKTFAREVRFSFVSRLAEQFAGMSDIRAEKLVKDMESLVLNGKLRRSKADV